MRELPDRSRCNRSLRLKERRIVVVAIVVAVPATRTALVCERIKGTQIRSRSKIDEGRRDRNDRAVHYKDVEVRPERGGVAVQQIRVNAGPVTSLQSSQKSFNGSDGFGGRERTVPRAINEGLTQQTPVIVHTVNDIFVRRLVFNDDQAVALGVHRQNGNINLPVEDYILLQVVNSAGVRFDSRRLVQRLEVTFQAEAGCLIEGPYLIAVDGFFELSAVVHVGVPGDIPTGASFELSPEGKYEGKVNLLVPQKLVGFLAGEIGRSRLGR